MEDVQLVEDSLDAQLCQILKELPRAYGFRYTDDASKSLIELLFRSLVGHREDYLRLLFPEGPPISPDASWSLRDAQGAVEGAEYTEAARGHPCGHIFKNGEATYRCRTCTADDTCVLCAKCFEASDHEGHIVYVSVSPGNSGCCDCGDEEAWLNPVACTIHSVLYPAQSKSAGKAKAGSSLPSDLLESIRITISRVLDYLCDVWSCSPEQLRLPKTEGSVNDDEWHSRLESSWYGFEFPDSTVTEYALILWNDEKHTVNDVRDTVARACRKEKREGLMKAHEVDEIGRSVLLYSTELASLLGMAKIIEQPKLTVTIRSARDTFREYMCGTIIEWIADISGCNVGTDKDILRQTICEEMLSPWRVGSKAHRGSIGKETIDDHEVEDMAEDYLRLFGHARPTGARRPRLYQQISQDEDDDSDEDDDDMADQNQDQMDIDGEAANGMDHDMAMDLSDELDDALEASEATLAGYPPPPPPPAPRMQHRIPGTDSDAGPVNEPQIMIPKTPKVKPVRHPRPPKYWLDRPPGYARQQGIPPHEDLWRRVRLDFLILYDLRMWKKLRTDLRDVFISTVVTLPAFKRLLGLRFAAVYTVLAELYLIADREPDHSIINLSLQMLTTPSITAEVVERGNFLTNLMAILYTFLTTRQVGYPMDVDPLATLAFEQGAVSNRRICQFYMDMKYLLLSELVQETIRTEEKYLLQFLDLAKLHQGICPNVRAVGEHVEYETDAWITASIVTAEIMRLCRWIGDAFTVQNHRDLLDLAKAIRNTARMSTIHSLGSERRRFDQSEIKAETCFRTYQFSTYVKSLSYRVVEFDVMSEPMSFYHPLHYTLSWLIDRAKAMSSEEVRQLLLFTHQQLTEAPTPVKAVIPKFAPEDNLLALFDFPIRVCAWLAQMRAGLWVRNGMTLRHQMSTYRNVPRKDLGYQRDIFLVQVALVVCSPATILATLMTRFKVDDWGRGRIYDSPRDDGIDQQQRFDLAEDFVHLLIILLSERTHLRPLAEDPNPSLTVARRDIIHALCAKPLSHSELTNKLSEKISDSIEFGDLLDEMTIYRPPEGLNDSGTFALKDEYFAEIEPYLSQFNRNQREEADLVYRKHVASKTGKDPSEVVYEPKLVPIQTGLFRDLAAFTRTTLFTQMIFYFLHFATDRSSQLAPTLPITKVEQFLQFVLHLVLLAVLEDHSEENKVITTGLNTSEENSFCSALLSVGSTDIPEKTTIAQVLRQIAEMEAFKACEPKVHAILRHLRHKNPIAYAAWMRSIDQPVERSNTASPASSAALEKELRKKQALERQAKVMAQFKQQQATFMANQMDWSDDDFSDPEEGTPASTEEEQDKIWRYPTGTCILCQEETTADKLYGTFSLINNSCVFRDTNVDDPDWVQEVADTPVNLDQSAEAIRPFGVSGKNRRMVRKITADGRVQETERQELGKGFPTKFVGYSPVATGCGHIMHYSCFEIFVNATHRRHGQQIARNHPERLEKNEFLCPLCKALGNAFLPIVWHGKRVTYLGVLQLESTFEDFLNSQIGTQLSRHENERQGTGSIKSSGAPSRSQELFLEYADEHLIAPLANQIPQLTKPTATFHTVPTPPQRHALISQLPSFLQFGADDPSTAMTAMGSSDNATIPPQLMELVKVYQRLRDTLSLNHIVPPFSDHLLDSDPDDLTNSDSLEMSLATSINAIEIAQRGVESSPEATLLEKISPQTLTHLRVLSETVTTYLAIGSLRAGRANATYREICEAQRRKLQQLFIGHPQVHGLLPGGALELSQELQLRQPLLSRNIFPVFVCTAVYVAPEFQFEVHHIMRLCYFAEIVKVMLKYQNLDILENDIPRLTNYPASFPRFFQLLRYLDQGGYALDRCDFEMPAENAQFQAKAHAFYKIIETYALPFVRRCIIFMHVRYGIEFPPLTSGTHEPELTRLSRLLNLPTINEMFQHALASPPLRTLISGWIQHRKLAHPYQKNVEIPLPHPAIYELVGLPKTFDTLQDEVMKRRCPTTGKDLTDPCVCLFCGEIVCGQAVCCTNEEQRGGCYQHRIKYVLDYETAHSSSLTETPII